MRSAVHLCLCAVLGFAVVGPALAVRPPYQPDMVNDAGEDNIYNTTGIGQTACGSSIKSEVTEYYFSVQNDGSCEDSFVITGTAGNANWRVKYIEAESGTDITSDVVGAGWETPVVPAWNWCSRSFRVQVTPLSEAAEHETFTVLVTATSVQDPTKQDAAKAETICGVCQPDIGGDHLYSSTGIGWDYEGASPRTEPYTYDLSIYNAGTQTDSFRVTGPAGNANFVVKYYDTSSGTDITDDVTGAGWTTPAVSSGASRAMQVKVTPQASAAEGEVLALLVTATSVHDGAKQDAAHLRFTCGVWQPDAVIGSSGEDIHNSTGDHQTHVQVVDRGNDARYDVWFSNDGGATDRFRVTGPKGNANWSVRYTNYYGDDITTLVTGSGWTFTPNGDLTRLTVTVRPLAGAAGNESFPVAITAASIREPAKRDVVVAHTICWAAHGAYQPDLRGNYVYNSSGWGQIEAYDCARGDTVEALLYLSNRGSADDSFRVTGPSGDASWSISYYRYGGLDITSSVTGAGWVTDSLAPHECACVGVQITPLSGAAAGEVKSVLLTATSTHDASKVDVAGVEVTCGPYAPGLSGGGLQAVGRNEDASYSLSIENDGKVSDSFRVTGPGGNANWSVKYYEGEHSDNDITADVTGAGWESPGFAPGRYWGITAVVTPLAGAADTEVLPLLVTATSNGDPTKQDSVTLKTVCGVCQPDWSCNGRWNSTGVGQTRSRVVANGETASYSVDIRNSGSAEGTFTLTGTAGDANWDVRYEYYYRYTEQTIDITDQVTGPGWVSREFSPHEDGYWYATSVTVHVTPLAGAEDCDVKTVMVTAAATKTPDRKDVVRLDTTCGACQPDWWVAGHGDDRYNTTGEGQTAWADIARGDTQSYSLILENDSHYTSDTFTITGPKGDANWKIRYYDAPSQVEITNHVTGAGWTTPSLGVGGTREIYVLITPLAGAPVGDTRTVLVTATSVHDPNKVDVARVQATCFTCQPDWQVYDGSAYIGDNVYNTTGAGQSREQLVPPNTTARYPLRVYNDGSRYDSFTLTGVGSNSRWEVQYEDSASGDITSAVTNGGWTTPSLRPGKYVYLNVYVTPLQGAAGNEVKTLLLTATSQTSAKAKDVAKLTTTCAIGYQPDGIIRDGAASLGDNVYSTSGSGQTVSLTVCPEVQATHNVRFYSDGNVADRIRVTGPAGNSKWAVKYVDVSTGTDITADVTGAGWLTASLKPGAYWAGQAIVTPQPGVAANTTLSALVTGTSESDATKKDAVKATTVCGPVYTVDGVLRDGRVYIGDGEINTTGADQTLARTVLPGVEAAYLVRFYNDGNISQPLRITGPAGNRDWTVEYVDYATGADVTASVTSGGLLTAAIRPGAYWAGQVFVSPLSSAAANSSLTVLLTGASSVEASKKDVLEMVTTCAPTYRPDALIYDGTDYIGDDIYNTSGTGQTQSLAVAQERTATHNVLVYNDGNAWESIKVTGTRGNMKWTVKYIDNTTGADITAAVTGSGWHTPALDAGSSRRIKIQVTPGRSVLPGSALNVLLTATSTTDGTKRDAVKAVTAVK